MQYRITTGVRGTTIPQTSKKQYSDDDLEKLKEVENAIFDLEDRGLNLSDLLDFVCWGSEASISSPKCRGARIQLCNDHRLSEILSRMHTPPQQSNHSPGVAAKTHLEKWAIECSIAVIERDMTVVGEILKPSKDVVSKKQLLSIDPAEILENIQSKCTNLWLVCRSMAWTINQDQKNASKTPDWVSSITQLVCIRKPMCTFLFFLGGFTDNWNCVLLKKS